MSAPAEIDPRSVFVKGVNFETTQEQFEAAFSEIGPVRRAFLLHKKGAAHHSGAGFVQFALIEDANRAVKEYDNKVLLGRTIQVTAAGKRPANAERRQEAKDKTVDEVVEHVPAKRQKSSMDAKKALQSIAIGSFTQKQAADVLKLAGLCGKVVDSVENPSEAEIGVFKLRQDGCTESVVFVTYATVKEACTAVTKLHHTTSLQSTGKAPVKKLWARQLKGEGSMVKKWRLILRNIPFNVSEEQLLALLSPAGFVWDLKIPQKPDGGQQGFAFASFTSRAHAEKAIKLANAQKLKGRVLAVDWALSKTDFQAPAQLQTDQIVDEEQEGEEQSASDASGSDEEMELDSDEEKERDKNLALAFLQSENKDTRVQGKKRSRQTTEEEVEDSQDGESTEDEAPEEPPQKLAKLAKQEGQATHDTDATAGGHNPQRMSQDKDKISRTVFIRGVANTQQKSDLHAVLAKYGRVRDCRLVMNAATQKPKGTAFVEFEAAEDAQKAAAACARGRAGQGPGVVLAGKQLEVDIALIQEDARTLASGQSASRLPADRRNLYLAKEGMIDQRSQAWLDMSKLDQQKRARADKEKTTKLKSPNFFISTTRLSIRNLPGSVNEKALKELLVAAVKERATKARPNLKQVKILRDATRLTKEGEPSSKGIAFAEFLNHEHALCALRQLNNNPGPFGKERRPIVEFSVENAQTVRSRKEREAKRKGNLALKKAQHGSSEAKELIKAEGQNKRALQGSHIQQARKRGTQEKGPQTNGAVPKVPNVTTKRTSLKQASAKDAEQPVDHKQTPRILRPTKGETRKRGAETPAGHGLKKETLAAKKQKNTRERKDNLDALVDKYRASLAGGSGTKSTSKATPQRALKRWFD